MKQTECRVIMKVIYIGALLRVRNGDSDLYLPPPQLRGLTLEIEKNIIDMIIISHDTIESTEFRRIGNCHFQLCPLK